MKLISVAIPDDLATLLDQEARRRGQPISEVIRDAVASTLGVAGEQARQLKFAALGKSGEKFTARNAEAILAREWTHAGNS